MYADKKILFQRESEKIPLTKEEKEIGKLENLAVATVPLFKTRTVFPFHLFPDEIVIDPLKISIIHHIFFETKQIYSIEIKNIIDVSVESGPFFATLTVSILNFPPVSVSYMKKEDAVTIQRIIQGLLIAQKQGVNVSEIHTQNIVSLIQRVGKTQ